MKKILYVKSSVLGDQSQTSAMVDALHAAWSRRHPQAEHVVRDLAAQPLPYLQGTHLAAAPAEGQAALEELKQADVVVLAAPMYNFGVPATLKTWLDHVLKAGQTFEYTSAGPRGLLQGKRAVLLASTGGVYSEGPYAAADFVVPYLKTALGFIGIADVEVVRIEGVAMGEQGAQSRAQALQALATLS